MHVLIFWPREYKTRYRTSTGESSRSMRDDACCDFSGQENTKPDIAHRQANRVVRCAMMHVVILWPREYKTRYRTSTGESSRSMCDDACWFSGQENTKPDIAHRLVNRVARCAMMHVVICMPCSEHKLRDFRTPYWTITNAHTWVLPIGRLWRSDSNYFCKVAQLVVLTYERW